MEGEGELGKPATLTSLKFSCSQPGIDYSGRADVEAMRSDPPGWRERRLPADVP